MAQWTIDIEKLNTLGLHVRPFEVNAATDDDWAAINALFNRHRQETDPDDPPIPLKDTVNSLRNIPPIATVQWASIWRQRDLVALASAAILNTDHNQHILEFELYVAPEERRRQLGSELLRWIYHCAQETGRTLLLTNTDSAIPAGEAFMGRLGAQMGLAGQENQLLIADLDHTLIKSWLARAHERASDLTLGVWVGPYPEAELAAIADLAAAMNSAPKDDLAIEDMQWTPDQLRAMDKAMVARGVERWTLYVNDSANGAYAGYTEVFWRPSNPETLRQGSTVVLPAYRNRGVGRWLKAAMIEKVLRDRPQVKRIRTGNAASNDAMLKINHQLGFKLYRTQKVWQMEVNKLDKMVFMRENLDV